MGHSGVMPVHDVAVQGPAQARGLVPAHAAIAHEKLHQASPLASFQTLAARQGQRPKLCIEGLLVAVNNNPYVHVGVVGIDPSGFGGKGTSLLNNRRGPGQRRAILAELPAVALVLQAVEGKNALPTVLTPVPRPDHSVELPAQRIVGKTVEVHVAEPSGLVGVQ